MELDVKWSNRAEREFDKKFPESGQQTDNLFIRYKIVKDYFLYYSFDESTLYIVDVCDMRRNPEYIKSLIM